MAKINWLQVFTLSLFISLAGDRATASATIPGGIFELQEVHCKVDGGKFEYRKTFPAVKDTTTLQISPRSLRAGSLRYEAVHIGLLGGDCRIQFKSDYSFNGNQISIQPQRSTLQSSRHAWNPPCLTLTAELDQVFQVTVKAKTASRSEALILEGEDVTEQCPGSRRGTQVRFTFIKSDSTSSY